MSCKHAFTSTSVSLLASGSVTTDEIDRCGRSLWCSQVWKKTVTWSVASPTARSFSPSLAA